VKKIRLAIIGCGRISSQHFEAIEANSNLVELVSVCDLVKEKAEKAANSYGVSYYLDYLEMLRKEKIDAVSICTPSGLHPKHGMDCAFMGKHVLTEKPIGTSTEEARKLIQVCHENKVQLHVVLQNRLNNTIVLAKKAIEEKRLGKLYTVQSNVFWQRPQKYYDEAPWRGTYALDGGCFLNQASHYVDLICYLAGERITEISSYTSTLSRKIEAEDTGVACFKFENGAVGTLNVSMLTYPKNLEGSITLLGEKGTIRIGGVAVNKILHWEFEDQREEDSQIKTSSYETESVYGFGHQGYYRRAINSMLNASTPFVTGEEGYRSLAFILGCYESSKSKKSLSLLI